MTIANRPLSCTARAQHDTSGTAARPHKEVENTVSRCGLDTLVYCWIMLVSGHGMIHTTWHYFYFVVRAAAGAATGDGNTCDMFHQRHALVADVMRTSLTHCCLFLRMLEMRDAVEAVG